MRQLNMKANADMDDFKVQREAFYDKYRQWTIDIAENNIPKNTKAPKPDYNMIFGRYGVPWSPEYPTEYAAEEDLEGAYDDATQGLEPGRLIDDEVGDAFDEAPDSSSDIEGDELLPDYLLPDA
eukprot:GDKJ01023721.1.p1 GENE.GDKJ01023721.1~~GDKJ01023721.1.p1  ORF type:complete len:124 (+),score=6.53 GDKJ01023721.1:2-373(+)